MALEGIDLAAALRILGGSTKLYVRLLGKFNMDLLNKLTDVIDAGGVPEDVQAAAHAIKGVGANLGFPDVQRFALAVESKAKVEKQVVTPHDADYLDLVAAYNTVYASVQKILADPSLIG